MDFNITSVGKAKENGYAARVIRAIIGEEVYLSK